MYNSVAFFISNADVTHGMIFIHSKRDLKKKNILTPHKIVTESVEK